MSKSGEEMRKYIDTFSQFSDKKRITEVIVSYDCSEILHKYFGDKLLDFLKEDYDVEMVTKSTYKIARKLSFSEIDKLKKEILELFTKTTKSILESTKEKRTVVTVVTPSENQFIFEEIINKTE